MIHLFAQVVDVVEPAGLTLSWAELFVGLAAVLLTFLGLFVVQRKSVKTASTQEIVDGSVLEQFSKLYESRVHYLEQELASTKADLRSALADIKETKKFTEFLQASLKEKDNEIRQLNVVLERYRKRIAHLERVCKTAGINGDDC